MTDVVDSGLDDADQPASDQYLIALVRGGDNDAYGVLYARHVASARRLARVLIRDQSDVDDLVADAFVKVLVALRTGKGPDSAFRAYLLTTMKHARYDRFKVDRRVEYTDDLAAFEKAEPPTDPTIERLETSYAAKAFARLPERWRTVLWHTEVEGESPAQVAPLLGLTPNGVAALAYRARERLRQMYLQEHIAVTGSPRCHWTGSRLAGYVRAALARRDRGRVEDHLSECAECRRLHRELAEENSGLRVVLAPLLLGAAAPGYLAEIGRTASGLLGLGAVGNWVASAWASLVFRRRQLCQQTVDALAGVGPALAAAWSWLLALPRRLIHTYGPGNVAAGTGLVLATALGVLAFAVFGGAPGRDESPAALPVPAPADLAPAVPAPDSPEEQPVAPPPPLVVPSGDLPRPALSTLPKLPPDKPVVIQRPVTDSPRAPAKTAPASLQLRPDPAGAQLIAGEAGVLRIPVRLSESAEVSDDSASPAVKKADKDASPAAEAGKDALRLTVRLPEGLTLRAGNAGDGWTCRASGTDVECARRALRRGQRTVAKVPVTVAAGLSGFLTIEAAIARTGKKSTVRFRAPVAPRGLRVGYAATGRLGFGLAGNTLISCDPRPACWKADNNQLDLNPLMPASGEAKAPRGLTAKGGPTGPDGPIRQLAGAKAASGARLQVPRGAAVRWAGLIVASTKTAPTVVALHGPGGTWRPVRLHPTRYGDPTVRQAFAEVTGLVRSGGEWWLAASAGQLPRGEGAVAGWSLLVVYDAPAANPSELAVYLGPSGLAAKQSTSVRLGAKGPAAVGVVLWDGDLGLTGDNLRLGAVTVGNPTNLGTGHSPSATALHCGKPRGSCQWRSIGVDVLRFRSNLPAAGDLVLHTGSDPMDLGLLVIQTPIGPASAS